MKVIIIGGVAGGASTAARLRRLDEKAEITIYERSGYISYANCGLPYYLGGVITDKDELTLQTPDSFYRRFRIVAKVNHEVININPDKKRVTVHNLASGEVFEDGYDKLVISTGAKALIPASIQDTDIDNIFTLRTVEDTFRIHDYIKENGVKSAVVVGGGFVGIETAENLKHMGLDVTLIEGMSQVLSVLDEDMVTQVHSVLRKNGINLMLGGQITSFRKEKQGVVSTLLSGESVQSDIVLLSIGVVPDTKLADVIGLEKGIKGSIIVSDKMETSIPDIYAVGDAVAVKHFVTDKKALISLAGPANKQGRIAADNIAGLDSHYNGSQGSAILKIFDMTVAVTGINERQAKEAGIDFDKVIISPLSHASYYPDGKVMTLKLLFDKESHKILGSQIVGVDGVDKRIDVIATAIRAGLNAAELAELELSYAPPYSSAKDPVNMAGFVAENLITGKVKQFYYEDIKSLSADKNVFLLDTRTVDEYARGCAKGFINIPVDELRDRYTEIPKDKPIYIMCQSGIRSYIACRILIGLGFDCYNFAGGYRFYSMQEN